MTVQIWIKVAATKKPWGWKTGPVQAFKVKPSTKGNEIALRLEIEIPDEVFEEPIFEAKLVLPKTSRKLPEMTEISKAVGAELSKQMGFRVKLDIPPYDNAEN